MDGGQLVDVTLPRGYAKWRLIDHAGGHFWAKPSSHKRGEPHHIARFGVRV